MAGLGRGRRGRDGCLGSEASVSADWWWGGEMGGLEREKACLGVGG